jgi:hypothetical protein
MVNLANTAHEELVHPTARAHFFIALADVQNGPQRHLCPPITTAKSPGWLRSKTCECVLFVSSRSLGPPGHAVLSYVDAGAQWARCILHSHHQKSLCVCPSAEGAPSRASDLRWLRHGEVAFCKSCCATSLPRQRRDRHSRRVSVHIDAFARCTTSFTQTLWEAAINIQIAFHIFDKEFSSLFHLTRRIGPPRPISIGGH